MSKFSHPDDIRALELHNSSIIVDAHSDIPFDLVRRPRSHESPMKQRHIPNLRTGGVDVVVCALTWDGRVYLGELLRALKALNVVNAEVERNADDLVVARNTSEIRKAKEDGKISLILGFEGGKPLEGELTLLKTFYDLGVRYLGLTWNHRNQLADGVGEPTNSGLSNFGREVVLEANRLGVMLDVSHISEKGFWDVIELSKEPVMASHSNSKTLCNDPRNLTDDQIKALCEKGGVIGVNFVSKFLQSTSPRRATLDDVLDHIDYIADLVGVEHVGLGPDFMDYSSDLRDQISKVKNYVFNDEWSEVLGGSPSDTETYPENLESITKLPNLTCGLIERSYSDNEIKKILGRNFLRLFKKILN